MSNEADRIASIWWAEDKCHELKRELKSDSERKAQEAAKDSEYGAFHNVRQLARAACFVGPRSRA